MGKLGVVSLAFVLAAACLPQAAAFSSGAPDLSSGGAFPGERSCTQCHVGSDANSGPGTLTLTVGGTAASSEPDAPALTYTPGETIALIVSFEDTTKYRVGFQLTVRSGDGCGQPGSLAAGPEPDGSGIKTGSQSCGPAGTQVEWVTHQTPRNGSSANFAIDWTAPAEDVGPVTVAVAVNGADGSRDARNDNIYTLQAVLQPGEAPTPSSPMISEGGVTSLGDVGSSLTKGAPGGIAVISGTGLADTGEGTVGSVGTDGELATNVAGICVEVNQVRAPVLYAEPTEVFIQIPAETALGPAAVQVIRNCEAPADGAQEVLSNVAMFEVASVRPVLLQASESIEGAVAVHDDFSLVASEPEAETTAETPAMETSTMETPATETATEGDASEDESGPAMSPAAPGEVVTFFGTGFGPTDPSLATGQIPALSHVLAAESVYLMIGETTLPDDHILYAGASPGVAGLYQLSARIPAAVPAGEHDVCLLVDMQRSPTGAKIAVSLPELGGDEEIPICTTDMVLELGQSCTGTLAGITGVFKVEESQACIETGVLDPICSEESINLLGAFIAAKQSDGTWKITSAP